MSSGKIIGGIIGAIVGGPLGAGVGIFLGACADEEDEKREQQRQQLPSAIWLFSEGGKPSVQCPHCETSVELSNTGENWVCGGCKNNFHFPVTQETFITCKDDLYNKRVTDLCLFQVLGCISRSDGVLQDEELNFCDYMLKDLGFTEEDKQQCIEMFKDGLKTGDYHYHAKTLGLIFHKDFETRVAIGRSLARMAMVDDDLHDNELEIIHDIAEKYLWIKNFHNVVKEVIDEFYDAQSDDLETMQAFIELESNPEMSLDQVKRKYRELCMKFHPDTISSKQLPPEFVKFANDKLKALNKAYEIVTEYYQEQAA